MTAPYEPVPSRNRDLVTLATLALAILATRFEHFGPGYALPDATLAAFFVAGFQLASAWAMLPLFAAAAVADQLAFANGVSDACMTPAYAFLVPTCATLWSAGRRCRSLARNAMWWPRVLATLAAASVVAWFISSGSFYAFSGRYAQLPAADYLAATLPYLAPYAGWTTVYGALGLVAVRISGLQARRRATAGASLS